MRPTPIEKVLICFGGADPLQLTRRCLATLLELPELREAGVLTGSAFPHTAALEALAAAFPSRQVRFEQNASATEMVALFQHYHAIVCPASTILIESLVLGKAAITGYYADNQCSLANYVHQHQQAYSLGDFTALSDDALRESMRLGLYTLAHEVRRPYVQRPAPEKLRAEFERLLPG